MVSILYHSPCLDGSLSAWVAYQYFQDDASYIPVGHDGSGDGSLLLEKKDETLYFLDYAPSLEGLQTLLDNGCNVHILDHHVSAYKSLSEIEHPNLVKMFDLKKSGAGLSWDYFLKKERPLIVDIIEAIDLSNIDFFETPEQFFSIAAYCDTLPLDNIHVFDDAYKTIEGFEKAGSVYRDKNLLKIKKDTQGFEIVSFDDKEDTVFLNIDLYQHSRELVPYIREKTGLELVFMWFADRENSVRLNIHSVAQPTAQDILKVIKEKTGCSGGGHEHSTVARMNETQFDVLKQFLNYVSS